MADDSGAGFTVKEMLVRVETKMDIVLADHEDRLRKIENSDAIIEGGITNREKLGAKVLAIIAVSISFFTAVPEILYYISNHG